MLKKLLELFICPFIKENAELFNTVVHFGSNLEETLEIYDPLSFLLIFFLLIFLLLFFLSLLLFFSHFCQVILVFFDVEFQRVVAKFHVLELNRLFMV